ncbi:MAG: type I restriction enzyme HsdR N-terminal domain-containing protein [Saprospiraceae bacterium]|nr:type I restriction enzyme HsdR N-terminal domain-containing protein [Saprospiraceae bacterium]
MDILSKILPNWETDLSLQKQYVPKLKFFEKEKGKWYLKSHDSEGKDKLVYNVTTGKSAPEEIVRQLFLIELTEHYHYPKSRLKCEQNVSFGRNGRGRADIVVYQEDETTPWILVEVKAPSQKNSIQQLKSYLNNEGSPLGVGVNGNAITRLFRPYPKEFDDSLPDIPTEAEYQQVKDEEHPAASIKDIILGRKWTLSELEKINENKQFNLRKIIEVLEELVLANSGADSFTEIFKLIYAKLYDEWEGFWGNSGANLTLLGGSKNIEASDNPFKDKINVYKGKGLYQNKNTKVTGYNITQKIVADFDSKKYNEEWNEDAIRDRWEWFCAEVAEVLQIDTSSLLEARKKIVDPATP